MSASDTQGGHKKVTE